MRRTTAAKALRRSGEDAGEMQRFCCGEGKLKRARGFESRGPFVGV